MSFVIQIRRDLSLLELRELQKQGFSVMKSPHVGNVYPNNLLVADLGIDMTFYDRTLGAKDSNFHPHQVIVHGAAERIGPSDVLTTHAVVTHASQRVPLFVPGQRVLDCHMTAMRQALPQAKIETYSNYLRRHGELAQEVLALIGRAHPRVWEFAVTNTGERVRYVQSFGAPFSIYGLTNTTQGVLIPNVLNILLTAVIECLDSGQSEVYHLSGPDMVRYITGMRQQLDSLYQLLREHQLPLPETLNFSVIPVAEVRLAVPLTAQSEVDDLVEAWQQLGRGNQERARMMHAAGSNKSELIPIIAQSKHHDVRRLREAALTATHVFYDIACADYFSQYDLLAGQQLYVHPWALEAPIEEIELMMRNALGNAQQ